MDDDLCFTPAVELANRLRSGDVSAREAVNAYLSRIERRNPEINAYVLVLADRARAGADRADRAIRDGEPLGPLHGVPICIKDLCEDIAGVRTTRGGPEFMHYVPTESSVYVERLENSGAIILGKTNVPELGASPNTGISDNRTFGATRSPLAPDRSSGGSSGGSAAAVVDGQAAVAQGADGGGSLRIPAAWCGAYSIKPSFGRVANPVRPDAFGTLRPHIFVGPISRTVADSALMLAAMMGPHERDPYSLPDDGFDPMAALRTGIAGMRIGYTVDQGVYPVDPVVAATVNRAVRAFEDAGARVEAADFRLPCSHEEIARLWLLETGVANVIIAESMRDQGCDVLGTYRDQVGAEFLDWVEIGYAASATDYARASVTRSRIFHAYQNAFE